MIENRIHITAVEALRCGDYVVAEREGAFRFSGYIETTAPGLGLAWLTDSAGYRRIIDTAEFTLWLEECPPPPPSSLPGSNGARPEQ